MGKGEMPRPKSNTTGVFDDSPSDAHEKVVRRLKRLGYETSRIAKATGLSETEVRKIIVRIGRDP